MPETDRADLDQGPNTEQSEYWNDDAGAKWVELNSFLDDQLRPLGLDAMQPLGPIDGKNVLDVGCGCGDTTLELGRRVGPSGSVVGIDLSAPMLTHARQIAAQQGLSQISFLRADAQTQTFDIAFDVVFSRFGVMFFADPTAAFANLRSATKHGATLAFICWRAVTDNEWMMVPVAAALQHLPPPEIPPAGAPGPFAFADADRLNGILHDAGFTNIEIKRHDTTVTVGAGRPLEDVIPMIMQMGPTGRLLQEASAETKSRVSESIREALIPYDGQNGLSMGASTWLVSGRNS